MTETSVAVAAAVRRPAAQHRCKWCESYIRVLACWGWRSVPTEGSVGTCVRHIHRCYTPRPRAHRRCRSPFPPEMKRLVPSMPRRKTADTVNVNQSVKHKLIQTIITSSYSPLGLLNYVLRSIFLFCICDNTAFINDSGIWHRLETAKKVIFSVSTSVNILICRQALHCQLLEKNSWLSIN